MHVIICSPYVIYRPLLTRLVNIFVIYFEIFVSLMQGCTITSIFKYLIIWDLVKAIDLV